VKRCPTCGANNRDDASFCSACGATFVPAPTPIGVPAMKPVPSVKVVTPMVPPGAPVRVPAPGMCFYHSNLPAVHICNRCGRSVCRDCSKAYMDLVLCPQCYAGVVPPVAPPPGVPGPAFPGPGIMMPPPAPRAVWAFVVSLIAGVAIAISSALYTWITTFFIWVTYIFPSMWPFALYMLISAVVVFLGALLMIIGYGTLGGIVVFVAATISLLGGGGFVAGFVLGMIGGILGIMGR